MTPTQFEAVRRRRAFHASIAARAVPDSWYRPAVIEPCVVEAPAVEPPKPLEQVRIPAQSRQLTIQRIYRAVCLHYGISRVEFMSRCRYVQLVQARYVGFYLAKRLLGVSYPAIARTMGTDHTSPMHGVHKIKDLVSIGAEVSKDVEAILQTLREDCDGVGA